MRRGDKVRVDVPGLGKTWGEVIDVLDRDSRQVHVRIGSGSMILPDQFVIPGSRGIDATSRWSAVVDDELSPRSDGLS